RAPNRPPVRGGDLIRRSRFESRRGVRSPAERSNRASMPTSPAVNVFDPAIFAAGVPHDAFRRLRDEAPVAWQEEHPVGPWPAGPGYWAVTRYAEVRHVLAPRGAFSSWAGATQTRAPDVEALPFIRGMILNMDAPE